jgi:hypothetical protein
MIIANFFVVVGVMIVFGDPEKLDSPVVIRRTEYGTCLSRVAVRGSYSSRRDIAVTCAIRKHPYLGVNLMSIRSCGCRARIIVLVEYGHTFDEYFDRIVDFTNAEVYSFVWNQTYYRHTDLARMIWLYDWLYEHRKEIDRVFWFDAFDVFFQSDPFKTLVAPGKMTFISEGVRIEKSRTNYNWIRQCYGKKGAESVKNGWVLCFGTVGGHIDAYLKFLYFMTGNRTRWFGCGLDQPQLNYYVHNGEVSKAGIEYQVQHCNGTVLSMSFCNRHKVHWTYEGRDFFDMSDSTTDVTAAVVHHYKHFSDVTRTYHQRCHYGVL